MNLSKFKAIFITLTFIVVQGLGLGQNGMAADSTQMAADMEFCKEHAKISSGYDPDNPEASVKTSSRRDVRREGLRGTARGAAKGAIVGGTVEAIGDDKDYDDAAEIGAGVGAVSSGLRSRRQAKDAAEAQEAQAISEGSAAYTNSYNECMRNKGH